MLEGLLLALGTAHTRGLGAITHHCALEEDETALGSRAAKKRDTHIQPGYLSVKSQAESLKSLA